MSISHPDPSVLVPSSWQLGRSEIPYCCLLDGDSAGRRAAPGPLVAPAVSPPVNETHDVQQQSCVRFDARPCDPANDAQKWVLMSGVKPGDGKPTTIKSAIKQNATCIQAENGAKLSCNYDGNTNGAHGGCKSKLMGPDGCKALPVPNGFNGSNACDYDQAFVFNSNGTVAMWNMLTIHDNAKVFKHDCMQINAKDSSVEMGSCMEAHPTKPDPLQMAQQKWDFVTNSDGTITIKQGGLCVDNNYIVDPVDVPALAHGGPWQPGA